MSDRELLELAAKASGIKGSCDSSSALRCVNESGKITYWNPLADDGDALRLAIKLNMAIDTCPEFSPGHWCVQVMFNRKQNSVIEYCVQGSTAIATRRAIVRAAAEIGRNMP